MNGWSALWLVLKNSLMTCFQTKRNRSKGGCSRSGATALELAAKSMDDCQKRYGTRKQELEDALKKLQQGKDALGQLLGGGLLREYRTEKENLLREMAYLAKISELEDYRQNWRMASPALFAAPPNTPLLKGISLSPMKLKRRSMP